MNWELLDRIRFRRTHAVGRVDLPTMLYEFGYAVGYKTKTEQRLKKYFALKSPALQRYFEDIHGGEEFNGHNDLEKFAKMFMDYVMATRLTPEEVVAAEEIADVDAAKAYLEGTRESNAKALKHFNESLSYLKIYFENILSQRQISNAVTQPTTSTLMEIQQTNAGS